MTAPRSPRAEIPGERLHRSGPWLIVHVPGDDPACRAAAVQRECEQRGVATRLLSLAEARGLELTKFRALVVVGGPPNMPTATTTTAEMRDLIIDYRARWSRSLDDLRSGRGDFVDCGVVQVVLYDGAGAVLRRPARTRVDLDALACAVHRVADLDPAALFEPYEGAFEPPAAAAEGPVPEMVDDREARRVWKRLGEWGLNDYRDVETILAIIEECRQKYESPRYTALRRPIAGRDSNRLDFVLDDRYYEYPPGPGRGPWLRDGQRVVRETTKAITEELPHVGNPSGTRGAVERFQDFYRNLRLMDGFLRLGR